MSERTWFVAVDSKPAGPYLESQFMSFIASGQVAQIPYHLNRAMDNGLTQQQAGEVMTHLAFYVGWPNAFSSMPVAKEVFEKRARPAQ